MSDPFPAELLSRLDDHLSKARARPRPVTLAAHQARLRSAGQRPLTRETALMLYPQAEVDREFAGRVDGGAGAVSAIQVMSAGALLFTLPAGTDEAQVQAAVAGWNAALSTVQAQACAAVECLANMLQQPGES